MTLKVVQMPKLPGCTPKVDLAHQSLVRTQCRRPVALARRAMCGGGACDGGLTWVAKFLEKLTRRAPPPQPRGRSAASVSPCQVDPRATLPWSVKG